MPTVPTYEEFEYVLREERDLPPEKRAVFRLRPLRYKESEAAHRVEFRQDEIAGAVLVSEPMRMARRVLNLGLLGWSGVVDAEGHEVPFRRNGKTIPEEILDLIAPWAVELSNAITEKTEVTEEQAKNS